MLIVPEDALLSTKATKSILDGTWTNGDMTNFSFKQVLNEVGKNKDICSIYVGTDSNPSKVPLVIAATVAFIYPSNGGNYYWSRTTIGKNRSIDLYERLFCEVQVSCNIALKIKEKYPDIDITVHLDINSDSKFASGKYADQFMKLVKAFGFIPIIKPRSWAASSIADKHVQ